MHRLFLVHPPSLDSLAAFEPPAMPIAFQTCEPYALHLYTILQNHTKSASSKVHAEFQSLIDSHLQYCPKSVFGLHLANNTHSITALFRKVKNMSDSIREEMHTGSLRTDASFARAVATSRLVLVFFVGLLQYSTMLKIFRFWSLGCF